MKQVIVVNEALRLPRGKLAAQVAHASVEAFLLAKLEARQLWCKEGMPKIVLEAGSDVELIKLEQRAREAGLAVALIRDAGHTVVAPGTVTCLGIGPTQDASIDQLTGDLKLVK